MRYQYTQTQKRYDGKRVYKPTYYPDIVESETDFYIIASEGQYLDSLAKKYYGDENYWWIIAKANNLPGYKMSVDVDRQLRIPADINSIIEELRRIN